MSYPNRSNSLKEGAGTSLHYKTLKTQFFKNIYLTRAVCDEVKELSKLTKALLTQQPAFY